MAMLLALNKTGKKVDLEVSPHPIKFYLYALVVFNDRICVHPLLQIALIKTLTNHSNKTTKWQLFHL